MKNNIYIHLTRIKPRKNALDARGDITQDDLLMMSDDLFISDAEKWQQLERDQFYLADLYNNIMRALSEKLNKIHQSGHSEKYWKILIGPWLRHYLYVLFRRYHLVNKLYLKYGKFQTIALDKVSFICPMDISEFFNLISGDKYNLQIYTRILDEIGLAEITEHVVDGKCETKKKHNCYSLKIIFFRFLFSIYVRIIKRRKKVIMVSPCFPKKFRFKCILKSFSRIAELPKVYFLNKQRHVISNKFCSRESFHLGNSTAKGFEGLCYKFVCDDLPKCFVENYKYNKEQAITILKKLGNISGIMTSNYLYYSDIFNIACALVTEAGKPLYGMQHGGNYRNVKINTSSNHELDIADRFYSWGWGGGKVTPRPCSKLVGINPYKFKRNNKTILYGLTVFPRFDFTMSEMSHGAFYTYLQDQKTFISKLCSGAFSSLVVRPHHEDHGWGIQKGLNESFAEIKFETWDAPFIDRIKKVKLYVCDHLSTTHIDSLALGVPTILFWPSDLYMLTDEAIPYYKLLEDSGILFHDPVKAAEAVSNIYKDVQSWWLNPKRQEAVAAFIHKYGQRNIQAQKIWFKELNSLVDV